MREDHLRTLIEKLPHVTDIRYGGDRIVTNCLVAPLRHESGVDRRPSMTITYDEGQSFCFCHSCGWKGSVEDALGYLGTRLPRNSDLRFLSGQLSLEAVNLEKLDFPDLAKAYDKRRHQAIRDHSDFWARAVKNPWSQAAIDLCQSKNVDPEFAKKRFGVAFIPEGTEYEGFGLDEFGDPIELSQDVLGFPALIHREGRLTCVGAQARPTDTNQSGSKYWSLLEGFKAHQHFYGYHLAPTWRRRVLSLVEGPFDAMHLVQLGMPALGLHGLYMSDLKANKLRLVDPSLVAVLLDPDTAGVTAAKRVLEVLTHNDFHATIIHLGLDPKHYGLEDLRHEAPQLFPDLQNDLDQQLDR